MAIRYQNCPWLKRESGQDTSESVYRMAAAELRAEKAWATEETERIEGAIAAKNREFIVANIKELSGKVWHRLSSAGFVEWGELLEGLSVRLVVKEGKSCSTSTLMRWLVERLSQFTKVLVLTTTIRSSPDPAPGQGVGL
jgi:hypothetical protein